MSEVQFFRERPKERIYIWGNGQGKNTSISMRHFESSAYASCENGNMQFKIDEAKKLYQMLGEAIEKAEKRALEEEVDDE